MEVILPTIEEAERIRAGDKALMDKYFLANYELMVVVAKDYCRKNGIELKNGVWEDMAQECYLYFPKFNFTKAGFFVRSIKDICVYARFGGERLYAEYRSGNTEVLTILDEPQRTKRKNEEGSTLGEMIASDFDIMDYVEPEESYTDKVYNALKPLLEPRQAEAFEYFYYSDMTAREVGDEMGITLNGAQSLKTAYLRRLRKQAEEVRAILWAVGLRQEYLRTDEDYFEKKKAQEEADKEARRLARNAKARERRAIRGEEFKAKRREYLERNREKINAQQLARWHKKKACNGNKIKST